LKLYLIIQINQILYYIISKKINVNDKLLEMDLKILKLSVIIKKYFRNKLELKN
jgi:hypothetical protein